jgi:hypothetical protein
MLSRQWVGGCSGLGHQRSGALKCLQYTDRSRFAALVSSQRHSTPCGFQQTDTPPYPHPPKIHLGPIPVPLHLVLHERRLSF